MVCDLVAVVDSAVASWRANPAIRVLGNPDAERLSITSFLVRYGDQFVHHNFVIALLNDLFGIQARGGFSCACPYGGLLLGLTVERGGAFYECVDEGWASLKPGWSRVNFNYFISQREHRFIVRAVHLVALYGWAMMPLYDFDAQSGLWKHRDAAPREPQRLAALQFDGFRMRLESERATLLESSLASTLEEGQRLLEAAVRATPDALPTPDYPDSFEENRWFPLPHEVATWLRSHNGGA